MIDVTQVIATCIASGVIGIGGSYMTYRLASARAEGRDEQWRKDQERRMQVLEHANAAATEVRAQNAVRLEVMNGNLTYLLNTVGLDGKHGLRGDMHNLRDEWTPILIRLQTLMERRE